MTDADVGAMLEAGGPTGSDRVSRTARPDSFVVVGRSSGMSETAESATRVVLSYDPAGIDDISRFWVEDELWSDNVAERLRDGNGMLAEDDAVEEFVSKGCGVILRVERGAEIGDMTAIDVRRQD